VGKLSVSILSADLAHLADQVKLVEPHADLIHIDVMDAHFAPPLTIGPVVVASLRPYTDLILHAHLQVEAPEGLFAEFSDAGTDMVSFHVEAVDDPVPVIRKAREAGMRVGMAVRPDTPVERVYPYLEDLDDVIVMGVQPGWAGQRLMPEALTKLEALRAELDRRGLSTDVQIDGGVKLDNARRCMRAGATVLISASAIFQAPDAASAARELAAIAKGGA
jgi:ribulose-phosphate 3-epimerase